LAAKAENEARPIRRHSRVGLRHLGRGRKLIDPLLLRQIKDVTTVRDCIDGFKSIEKVNKLPNHGAARLHKLSRAGWSLPPLKTDRERGASPTIANVSEIPFPFADCCSQGILHQGIAHGAKYPNPPTEATNISIAVLNRAGKVCFQFMPITKKSTGDSLELFISGRVDGGAANELEIEILEAIRTGVKTLYVNFADATFLCSAGLRVLLQYWRQMKNAGKALWVANPSSEVDSVLTMTGFREQMVEGARS
jgi:anti-anti-sigma factor